MLAIIRDDTWNVLNIQHITPNAKRWDYPDIPSGGHKKIKVVDVGGFSMVSSLKKLLVLSVKKTN